MGWAGLMRRTIAAPTRAFAYLGGNRAAFDTGTPLARPTRKEPAMSLATPLTLRRTLLADAAVTAATGVLLVAALQPLAWLLGLSASLLLWSGASFVLFAALVAALGLRAHPPRAAVWAVVAYNAAWAVDSLLVLTLGWVRPTLLGAAFVVFQAVVVALFAGLQGLALRRAPALA